MVSCALQCGRPRAKPCADANVLTGTCWRFPVGNDPWNHFQEFLRESRGQVDSGSVGPETIWEPLWKKKTRLEKLAPSPLPPGKVPLQGRGCQSPPSLASHVGPHSVPSPASLMGVNLTIYQNIPSETQTLWFQNIIIMQPDLVTQRVTRNHRGPHNRHHLASVGNISKQIAWNWVVPRWAGMMHDRVLRSSLWRHSARSSCLLQLLRPFPGSLRSDTGSSNREWSQWKLAVVKLHVYETHRSRVFS